MAYYRYTDSNYQRPSMFGGFQFFPPVIKALLIGNVAVFFLTIFVGSFSLRGLGLGDVIMTLFPLHPLGAGFQPWQLFTYLFMHGGLMHLFFNMLALWMFGMELENTWGSKKFLGYYLLCGIGAGISNLLVGPFFGQAGPTVGASGAIYGVLVAFGMMFPDRPIFVYFVLPIRARYFVLFYMVIEVYSGVTGTMDGVAHFAHLGGAAVGAIYMLIDQRRFRIDRLWSRTRDQFVPTERVGKMHTFQPRNISDATYHDVGRSEEGIDQQQIDDILDKISQDGYQSLTEQEKKILFEASKKLN